MRVAHQVPSTLLLLRFGGHPDSAAFAAFIRRQVRDLDMIWEPPRVGGAEGRSSLALFNSWLSNAQVNTSALINNLQERG